MLDVLMVAFGLGLFLLAVGYAHALARFTYTGNNRASVIVTLALFLLVPR
jgi:dipeptide/tripeptide permease